MVPCQLPLRLTLRNVWLWDCQNTCVISDFSQCSYHYSNKYKHFLWYNVQIHTNVQYVHVHTDTACVQHINVGLAHSLIPSSSLQLSPVAVSILSIIRTVRDNSCGYEASLLRLGPMPKKWSGQTGLTDWLLLLWYWLSEKPSCTKISTCGPQLITESKIFGTTHTR